MSLTRWLATFLGFPIGGWLAVQIVGSVDGPTPALLAGLVAGAVVGTAQWLALRGHGVGVRWAVYTAAAMAAGNGVAAAVTNAGTTVPALMVSGLIAGVAVGAAQGVVLGRGRRIVAGWTAVTSLAWALGWLTTANVIVDAERGYVSFGASGAILVTLITGFSLRWMLAHSHAPAPRSAVAVSTPTTR